MTLQVVINGMLLGGIYALVALGFSLVWGVMNIINVSHGALIMLGAYTTYWLYTFLEIDPFLILPMTAVILFVFGSLLQKYVINFIVKAPLFVTITMTFGLDILLVNIAIFLWTANYRSITTSYSGVSIQLGDAVVPVVRLAALAVALLLSWGLHLYITRVRAGRAIRAIRMDREAAKIMGIKIDRIYVLTFGIGAALAGAAGALHSMTASISPVMGGPFLVRSFLVCVLGGLGSIPGALVGGLALGLFETFGSVAFGPGYKDAISLVVLLGILVVRPRGLLGRKYYE